MKLIDALNLLSLSSETITLTDVKSAYRKACKTYHPDLNPAGHAIMQAVNEAYETLLAEIFPIKVEDQESFSDYGLEFTNALNSIINLQGLIVEVCGSWIWASGDTRPYKEQLKLAKFSWSPSKLMWYFRPETSSRKRYRGNSSIDEIRSKYGSEFVATKMRKVLPS